MYRTSGYKTRLSQLDGHSEASQLDWGRVLLGGQQHAVRLKEREGAHRSDAGLTGGGWQVK